MMLVTHAASNSSPRSRQPDGYEHALDAPCTASCATYDSAPVREGVLIPTSARSGTAEFVDDAPQTGV